MKKRNLHFLIHHISKLLTVLFLVVSDIASAQNSFKAGDEVLLDSLNLLKGKRIALITNKSAILPGGTHISDELLTRGIDVRKIFSPEHGFEVNNKDISTINNVEVISIYDKNKTFTSEQIKDIDAIIFDIQDLGVRYYTYVSTLYLTMKSACENGMPFILCDRPAIGNPDYVSGYMLDEKYSSFVRLIPVTSIYGMTIGELGNFLYNKITESCGNKFDFRVMKMQWYNRSSDYKNLYSKWVDLSPNITSIESGRIYPALVYLEGTNISEGRGTDMPFRIFGAPFCKSEEIISQLEKYEFKSVKFSAAKFTPHKNDLSAMPKFCDEQCEGVKIEIRDLNEFKPMEISVAILLTLKKLYPEFQWTGKNFIDKLVGKDTLRNMIDEGKSFDDIINSYKDDVDSFNKIRKQFLFY